MFYSLISLWLLALSRGYTQSFIEMNTHYNNAQLENFNFGLAPEERLGMPMAKIMLPSLIMHQANPSDIRWSIRHPYKLAYQKAGYCYTSATPIHFKVNIDLSYLDYQVIDENDLKLAKHITFRVDAYFMDTYLSDQHDLTNTPVIPHLFYYSLVYDDTMAFLPLDSQDTSHVLHDSSDNYMLDVHCQNHQRTRHHFEIQFTEARSFADAFLDSLDYQAQMVDRHLRSLRLLFGFYVFARAMTLFIGDNVKKERLTIRFRSDG